MSTPNPTHIDVIAKHSLEFSEFYVEWRCRCEHPEARWRGAGISVRPLHAAHVVSKLMDAGYSIVPTADVKSVRLVAEYALHLRTNGECAPGGDETWAKFDRFADAVLRGTDAAADDPNETAGQYMHRTGQVPPWFTAATEGEKP